MTPEQRAELRKAAEEATPGLWMRLFGERTVYDRMEDGCRGNAIARADIGFSQQDAMNLDYIAAANPATILQLLDYVESLERDAARYSRLREYLISDNTDFDDDIVGCYSSDEMDAVIDAMGESK